MLFPEAAEVCSTKGSAMRISQILTMKRKDLVSVSPAATLRGAVKLMKREHVGAVLVLDADQRLLGVLSERDIVHSLDSEIGDAFERPVLEVMRRENPVASAQDTVQSVMQTMTATRARHVPIVEWGRVIGIVSIGDIVKSCLEEKNQENMVLQDLARARVIAK
jgi:CBS domain-containing protein